MLNTVIYEKHRIRPWGATLQSAYDLKLNIFAYMLNSEKPLMEKSWLN